MKVYQALENYELPLSAQEGLEVYRNYRGFNVEKYVELKAKLLNNYMKKSGLKTAVVALSGGIDSAVVFALCDYAARLESAFKVFPVTLPAVFTDGVTHQRETVEKALDLGHAFGYEVAVIPVDNAANNINALVSDKAFWKHEKTSEWAMGQLVPYTRTPFLYFITSRFSDIGENAVIVGTTNRDEGAYLGYVGKASDGMVDLQLISDLHKSEVYKVAGYLNVTDAILDAIPTGDMYDGRADIEVFGASYDMVEYLLNSLSTPEIIQEYALVEGSTKDISNYTFQINNLETLHKYNAHKYNCGSPAVHLDIMPSGVTGGWKLDFENKYRQEMFSVGNVIRAGFVSPVQFDNKAANDFIEYYNKHYVLCHINEDVNIGKVTENDKIKVIEHLISDKEAKMFMDVFMTSSKVQANVHGRLNNMDTVHNGSDRVSWYSVELADMLFQRLNGIVEKLVVSDDHTIPGKDGAIYRAVGVNPLMRFISYHNGGMLVPHYDYPFVKDDNILSLWTLVIYLTDNETGATRFIKEIGAERGKSLEDFTYDAACDFNQFSTPENFILKNKPKRLAAALFPHYMLHDCENVLGEHKLIIRTDIMYEMVRHSD